MPDIYHSYKKGDEFVYFIIYIDVAYDGAKSVIFRYTIIFSLFLAYSWSLDDSNLVISQIIEKFRCKWIKT